ncbi:hypothetical protein ACJJTC_007312 [Scirpophaga incertulas]
MISLIIFVFCILFVYFYKVRYFKYWKERGVKHDEPTFLFGNNFKNYLFQSNRVELITDVYCRYPEEKVVGFYRSSTPELIIRDPEIIKTVLTSDFAHFYARGINPNNNYIEPVLKNLAFVEGDLWKGLNLQMRPAFSIGKLKSMFPLMIERSERLQKIALTKVKENHILDAQDLMGKYVADFIGSCGFGLDTEALNNEKSEFHQLVKDIFRPPHIQIIKFVLKMMFPILFAYLKFFDHVEKRISSIVNQVKESRDYKPSGTNDYLDQLLEFKEKGPVVLESIENFDAEGKPNHFEFKFDNDMMIGQVFLLFAGGFETSTSATSYVLHELAFNPHVQRKVQENIDRVLEKHDNKLSFEAVNEMTYLEWTLKEGLRKFPSVGYLMRKCTKQYTFKDLGFTINKGVNIMIPIQALNMDPKYWHDPEEFRPERFSPEEFTNVQKDVFFVFGVGPRKCIGERLGLKLSLTGLAAILSKFT